MPSLHPCHPCRVVHLQLVAIRKKFGQSLEVMRNYQTRIEELESAAQASAASVGDAVAARAADAAVHQSELSSLRAQLQAQAAADADRERARVSAALSRMLRPVLVVNTVILVPSEMDCPVLTAGQSLSRSWSKAGVALRVQAKDLSVVRGPAVDVAATALQAAVRALILLLLPSLCFFWVVPGALRDAAS